MWSAQDEGRASSLYQKCEAGKANDAVLSQNLDILPLVAAWDRVTRIGVTLVSYVRGRRNRSGGRELNQIFDEFFTKYWMLRLRLRVIGRRSVAQQRVLGDLYLSNHLASFVIGDGVLSSRPAS